jgi:hypothetical protein
MNLTIAIGCLVVIGAVVWFLYFGRSARRVTEAHNAADRAFPIIKVQTWKALVDGGVEERQAGQVVNAAFDAEWHALKQDTLFLASPQHRLTLAVAAVERCLNVVEQDYPGTRARIEASEREASTTPAAVREQAVGS